jgi:hypothetical protein
MACVALAWPLAFAATSHGGRPYPIGSTNGSIWNTIFVWNGVGRVGSGSAGPAAGGLPPALLLAGMVAVAAIAVAIVMTGRRRGGRLPFALGVALAAWLVIGLAVLGYMHHVTIRYIEPVNPAIAAALGIGLVLVARATARSATRVLLPVAGLIACGAVLVALTIGSMGVIGSQAVDAGAAGKIAPSELGSLSRYLAQHRGSARYEFAAIEAYQAGPLIAADGQPVLILASSPYHPLVSTRGLSRAVRAGEVRYVLVSAHGSGSGGPATFVGGSPRRAPMVAWVRRHGTDVSRSAGLAHAGALYRVGGPAPGGG